MGNKVCGSKREDTVIVYDERDRPRRVSASEYAHIKAAEQRKLQNMGYDGAPPAGSYAQGARRSGVRDEVPVEPIPEYVVDYTRDQAQLREELERDKLQQREMEERDIATESRLVVANGEREETSLMDQNGGPALAKGASLKEGECVVCLDAARTHLMHPCGHLSMCETCAGALMEKVLPKCPICRQDVDSVVKVWR